MKKLNKKGFTLIELITTVVILALVMSIGAVSITAIMDKSKEKDYQLFIKEIKNATEEFYIECTFDDKTNLDCPTINSGYYKINLGTLISSGHLKGNSTKDDKITLVNPKDSKPISNCEIKYKYENAKIIVEAINQTGSCPTTEDYKENL